MKVFTLVFMLAACGRQEAGATPSKQATEIASHDGSPGADGANGAQGPKGDKGDKGDQGAKGDKGDTGLPGANGHVGDTGPAGSDGAPGAVGQTGVAGPVGGIGAPGPAGPQGATGATGAPGAAGAPASFDWTDPVTGRAWIQRGYRLNFPDSQCGANFILPTAADLTTAIANGLGTMHGPKTAKASDPDSNGFAVYHVFIVATGATVAYAGQTYLYGVYCVSP